MASRVSLESVPIVDDHCHASASEKPGQPGFRTVREQLEMYAEGYLESRIPPDAFRQYVVGTARGKDTARLAELEADYPIRQMMDRSVEFNSAMVFTRALQFGCTELYGEWEDRDRLARLCAEARQDGFPSFWESILKLENCAAVIADVPRLDPAFWPRERFKWVTRLDPFLYPFGPGPLPQRGTDPASYHSRIAADLRTALEEQGLDGCPTDFADYLAFVDRAMDSFVERGVVGFKVVSGYVRTLEFRDVPETEAARVYGDLARGRKEETRLLEDFMARRLLLWSGQRAIPVQFHVGTGPTEPGLDFDEANPLALQSVLKDERFNSVPIVLLHGAYPHCSEASALAWTYGNVYLDFSWMPILHFHFLRNLLSEWLEFLPAHKLLLGTDTGLAEMHLGGMRLARRAIEDVLSRGVEDGLWTPKLAEWLGERVCYRNVCELYGFAI